MNNDCPLLPICRHTVANNHLFLAPLFSHWTKIYPPSLSWLLGQVYCDIWKSLIYHIMTTKSTSNLLPVFINPNTLKLCASCLNKIFQACFTSFSLQTLKQPFLQRESHVSCGCNVSLITRKVCQGYAVKMASLLGHSLSKDTKNPFYFQNTAYIHVSGFVPKCQNFFISCILHLPFYDFCL